MMTRLPRFCARSSCWRPAWRPAAHAVPPAVATAPRYPEFIFPALAPPVIRAWPSCVAQHDAGWRGCRPAISRAPSASFKRC